MMSNMKILVVSACSAEKKHKSLLKCSDLDSNSLGFLLKGTCPEEKAKEMYTGQEHQHTKKAVEILSGLTETDWYIISAGFGLINNSDVIVPYECTFSEDKGSLVKRAQSLGINLDGKGKKELIKSISEAKEIEKKLKKLYQNNYDIIFFILGTNYLYAISDAIKEIPGQTRGVFFVSDNLEKMVPDISYRVKSTKEEMKKLKTMMIELKGLQFLNLARNLKNDINFLEKLNDPNLFYELSLKQSNTDLRDFM